MATQFFICTQDFKGYDRPVPVGLWTRDQDLTGELTALLAAQFGRKGKLTFYTVAVRTKVDSAAFMSELQAAQAGRRGRYAKLVCRAAGHEIARLDAQLLHEPVTVAAQAPPRFNPKTGVLTIGQRRLSLEGTEAEVLGSLVKFNPSTLTELRNKSLSGTPNKVLKQLVDKYKLEKYITFPGKRGNGGYSTTIEPV